MTTGIRDAARATPCYDVRRVALIEIRGVRKGFEDQQVLRGLDLDVHAGEFLTLIGGSASGKSLLLKIIMGLVPVDAGTLRFDGQEVTSLREREWIAVRRRIGIQFQAGALFDSLSVFDNVAYGLREQRVLAEPDIRQRVSESLEQVSLPGIEAMWPSDLSGGMRKRVALARAIALRPEVLLYDDPTEGLDPINVTRVNRLLLALRDRLHVTTVVVTHNMSSAFSISDRIAFLHEGRIAHTGTPQEMRALDDERLAPFVRAAGHSQLHRRAPSIV
ncbi:MAG: ATP-binding cassette domain-containing protein [Myxococcota bacterium]|nr:ATP-binding cassette domain-containing protein [Myxococcota bacterium]